MSDSMLGDLMSAARDMVTQVGQQAGASMRDLKATLDEIEKAGRRTRVDATVTSAVPLTEGERTVLEDRLHARYGHGLPITYQVDPAILGGLVVRVGDRYIDGSVAARLGQLRQTLTGGSVG